MAARHLELYAERIGNAFGRLASRALMNKNDSQLEVPETRVTPSVAFSRHMIGVRSRCKQLSDAVRGYDLERVIHLTGHAAQLWLSARRDCRRVLQEVRADSLYAESARSELEETYMNLLETFRDALDKIHVSRVRRAVLDARALLTTANAEPLIGSGGPVLATGSGGHTGKT
jgi:hypothetical protein